MKMMKLPGYIPAVFAAAAAVAVTSACCAEDQNLKDSHNEFRSRPVISDVVSREFAVPPLSPYQLFAGTVIPGVLVTGMNSDLPGTVIGQVSQNVYDTVSGKYLLIPQGTRIIGTYDTKTAFAQNRGAVIWQRMVMPDGESIVLPNFDGSDQAGYTGFRDKVRSHYGRVIWSALLGSAAIGAVASAADSSSGTNSFRENASSEMESSLGGVVERIVDKNLNIAPTVIIRPGYRFNIIVGRDLLLKPYGDT